MTLTANLIVFGAIAIALSFCAGRLWESGNGTDK